MNDLRFAIRLLFRQPLFVLVASATLALGIGANVAIFSVINAVLLRPLPYPDAERLIVVRERSVEFENGSVSYPNYLDWREQNRSFVDLALVRRENFNVSGGAAVPMSPERISGAVLTANTLRILGVNPIHGRDLRESDDVPKAAKVVLIGEKLWRTRFGADGGLIGRRLNVDGVEREVIGIVPETMQFPRLAQLYVPLADGRAEEGTLSRGNHPGFSALGRLKRGVSLAQASADLDGIASALEKQYPDSNTGRRINALTLLDSTVGTYRHSLVLMLGAVGCVLLIACANVANLQLARASGRVKELAVRAALGAGRWEIARQAFIESLVVAALGAIAGVLLAGWCLDSIRWLSPGTVMRFQETRIDWPALGYTAAIAIFTSVAVGLWPALRTALNPNLAAALHTGGSRGSSDGPATRRVRSGLVIAQVALALILLAGAGLTLKSFWRAQQAPLGFDPTSILTMSIEIPEARYEKRESVAGFYAQLLERVAALPGVTSAAIGNNIPFDENEWDSSFHLTGTPVPPPGKEPSAEVNMISTDYFKTMGMRLIRGRNFGAEDAAGQPKSVIIDELFVRRHFPEVDPIGKQIDDNTGFAKDVPPMTIIGVVPRTRNEAPGEGIEANQLPQIYYAATQRPQNGNTLLVRTSLSDPFTLVEAIKREVRALDSDQPVASIATMAQNIGNSLAARRLTMSMLGAFAALALLLACVGLYGVMALNVTQRTRELGIRLALGAERRDVFRLVLRQGVTLVAIGLGAGLLGALGVARVFSGLLYAVDALDFSAYAIAGVALLGVAFFACWIPARRATRVDPVIALRAE